MARFSDLPSLSVRRPVLVVVINLLIVIAGLAAVLCGGSGTSGCGPTGCHGTGVFDGASPETMDAEVTRVIKALSPGSRCKDDQCRQRRKQCTDTRRVCAKCRSRRRSQRRSRGRRGDQRDLPEGVADVTIVKADADRLPVMRLALVSEKPLRIFDTVGGRRRECRTDVYSGGTVELFGDQEQVLRVVVDPIRLASYGLSIDEVANVLSSLSLDVPAGSFKSNDQLLMVRADASVWRPEAVERLAIRNDIKLGDVGQAFYGPAEAESYSLLNGRKVVGIGIVRRAQSNTIAISEAVQEAVERLNRRMKDVELIVISDDAQFIRSSVREVVVSLSVAVLVVIGVIFVFAVLYVDPYSCYRDSDRAERDYCGYLATGSR